MEDLLKRIKIEIVGNYRNFLPSLGVRSDGTWEIEILDKFESFMGPLECPIDREEGSWSDSVGEPLAGRSALVDLRTGSFYVYDLRRRSDCNVCSL
jgi:hypothetical protein